MKGTQASVSGPSSGSTRAIHPSRQRHVRSESDANRPLDSGVSTKNHASYLHHWRREETAVTIELASGRHAIGRIASFDQFTISLNLIDCTISDPALFFKSNIECVRPSTKWELEGIAK